VANDINNVVDIDIDDMISILSKTFDTTLLILFNTSSIIKLKFDQRFH